MDLTRPEKPHKIRALLSTDFKEIHHSFRLGHRHILLDQLAFPISLRREVYGIHHQQNKFLYSRSDFFDPHSRGL